MPGQRYFHGSPNRLDPGFVMRGRGEGYAKDWAGTGFYGILEAHRPPECLAHANAVFAVGHPDDIDLAGGATDWAFELEPIGDVSRHDLNWSSEISMLVSDGFAADSPEVIQAARNYWSGTPQVGESVWEYLMPAARILRVEPYEEFELDMPRNDGPAEGPVAVLGCVPKARPPAP